MVWFELAELFLEDERVADILASTNERNHNQTEKAKECTYVLESPSSVIVEWFQVPQLYLNYERVADIWKVHLFTQLQPNGISETLYLPPESNVTGDGEVIVGGSVSPYEHEES